MKPIFQVPIKYGVFGALMVIIMFYVFYFSGTNPLVEIRMFDFFIIPIFVFFAIKDYKDNYKNKFLEFWEGMSIGFVTYVTLALVTSLFIVLFLEIEDGSVFDVYLQDKIEILDSKKEDIIDRMGLEAYEKPSAAIQNTSKLTVAFDNFLKKTLTGLMLTIMIAVLMRRKQPENTNNPAS